MLNYTGWKRYLLAALLGVCSALALPPLYFLPLLIPSFSGLLLLVCNATRGRQAFFDGWWWGLGYFTAGLYWICISLYVEPDKFAWLTPFALFGLPSILGIYTGIVTFIVRQVQQKLPAFLLPVAFAIIFVAVEYARTLLFSGFPWNLIGYVWAVSDVTLQIAHTVGIYGLSFITVFAASAPALFVICQRPLLCNLLALLLLAFMYAYGWQRLEHHPTQYSNIKVRVVQPAIPESMKLRDGAVYEILHRQIALTHSPDLDSVKVVVWPEVAVPVYIDPQSSLTDMLGAILPEHALLITGGLRRDGSDVWNSLFAVSHNGKLMTQYDKHHLVPFGEFIPFRHILPLDNIAGGHGDFARGPGPSTLSADDIPPFSPLICYEAIFPEEATDGTGKAKWLLNVTNDAWFGASSGPYQHLEMARLRAVETGLPLVRAANTGISALVDPYGRIIRRLPLGEVGIIDFYLPLPSL